MRVALNQHSFRGWSLAYRRLQSPDGLGRLLLLHGAGVAGDLTWTPVMGALAPCADLLIPDLYGAGDTVHEQGEQAFTIADQLEHLRALLEQLGWDDFDVVGYSFGGLCAMELARALPARINNLVLIEPGLMERSDWQETLERRRLYTRATEPLKKTDDPRAGVTAFLDLVSPHRSRHPRVESRVISRLAHRPLGLAYALEAIAQHAEALDRPELIRSLPRTLSLVGSKTPGPAHELHQYLASQHAHWHYEVIEGCDHALPYQKPDAVGRAITRFLGVAPLESSHGQYL